MWRGNTGVKWCGVALYIGHYSRSCPELIAILGGKLISGYIISHDVCGRHGI